MNRFAMFICILVLTGLFLCNISVYADGSWSVDKNTIGLWKFDDGSGIIAADAVGKNTGKTTGCNWVDGKYGKALHFNGDGYYVDCGNGASDEFSSAITVEARFRLTDLNFDGFSWSNIVNQYQMGNKGYLIQFYLGQLNCGLATDSGWYNVEVGQTGFANQTYDKEWHIVRMIYDGSLLALWYDDNLVGSTKASGNIQPGKVNLRIGGFESVPTGRGFRGDIDEVRISNIARQEIPKKSVSVIGKNTVSIKKTGNSKCTLEETNEKITLRNALVEYVFDKTQGGILSGIKDKKNSSVSFNKSDEGLVGGWNVSIVDGSNIASGNSRYVKGEFISDKGQSELRIISEKIEQIYTLNDNESTLKCQAIYHNQKQEKVMIGRYGYALENLVIGESFDDNKFVYPPTWLHYMRGNVKDATELYMNDHYIYGHLQPTDKTQLPYSMIYNDKAGECITLAAVNNETKAWIGVLGGNSGQLKTGFDQYKFLNPGEKQELGTVYLSLYNKDWQSGMLDEKNLLIRKAGYSAPKKRPDFVNDLVILWDGFPGYGFDTFDGLAKLLPVYKELGINAMIIGGRTMHCYFDEHPESGVAGFIPIPKNGMIIPSEKTGGEEGLKGLVAKAHSLGMKLFIWGPTSLAGIDSHSEEELTKPDWWIYNKDGKLNKWYQFMLPPDSHSKGWQEFFLNNVSRLIKQYKLDGIWLDSSWQDHGLNYKAADGWYGGPNGAKIKFIEKIVNTAKNANPNSVVMSESSGAEIMSRVDINYLHSHGVWPAITPEELQTLIRIEEINRIPGMRPFGQIELGLGFYPDLGDKTSRDLVEKYKDSLIAKTFLVSTMDRVPVYFGLNWAIGKQISEGKSVEIIKGTENNPERLNAEKDKEKYRIWLDVFKTVNKVRTENIEIRRGDTIFDCVSVSSPSILHFVRSLSTKKSIILLNADIIPQTVNVKVSNMKMLELSSGKKYKVYNLMTGELIKNLSGSNVWKGSEISTKGLDITLDGYQGAILKIISTQK